MTTKELNEKMEYLLGSEGWTNVIESLADACYDNFLSTSNPNTKEVWRNRSEVLESLLPN